MNVFFNVVVEYPLNWITVVDDALLMLEIIALLYDSKRSVITDEPSAYKRKA